MTTAAPAPNDVLEKVDTLGPPGTPVTTPEVADGFDCTQRTIYNRLETLVEEGTLLTKKVGANSRVWWRPVEDPSRGSETHQATEQIRSHPVFDSELVGVVVWREDLTIGDANDAFLEMSGLDYEDAVGTSWRELTPAEFHSVSERQIDQFEETGSVTYEKQYYHADGSRWWGVFESRALDDAKSVEFVVDITERKEATRELQETNEQLTVALEAGGMGTWEWDLDARAGTGDEQFMRLWGLPGSDGPIPVADGPGERRRQRGGDGHGVRPRRGDPGGGPARRRPGRPPLDQLACASHRRGPVDAGRRQFRQHRAQGDRKSPARDQDTT
jgi:PAS domain S-box-containing protein